MQCGVEFGASLFVFSLTLLVYAATLRMLRSMVPAAVADMLGAPDAIQGVLAAAGSRATTASGKRPVSVPAGASDSAVAGSRGDAVAAVGRRVVDAWPAVVSRAEAGACVFTSHEGLSLGYEESLTRTCAERRRVYDRSAHMLWIGDRTRQLDHAHVEFFRGVANPLGVKLGPSRCVVHVPQWLPSGPLCLMTVVASSTPESVLGLLQTLCHSADDGSGRVCLITRMGSTGVLTTLPPIVRAVRKAGHEVVWMCDPMHGNTRVLPSGFKTRDFDSVVEVCVCVCVAAAGGFASVLIVRAQSPGNPEHRGCAACTWCSFRWAAPRDDGR